VYTLAVTHTAEHTYSAGPRRAAAPWLLLAASLPAFYAQRAHAEAAPSACLQAHTDAQVLRNEGKLVAAREQLLRCAQRDCPAVVIDDSAGWLPGVESSIPTAVFAISDPDGHDIVEAKVSDDTGRVLSERSDGRGVVLDPGVYTLHVEAPSYVRSTQRLVVRESEKNRIVRITLQPSAASSPAQVARTVADSSSTSGWKPIPAASWILGGTALASGIVFGVSGLLYLSAKSDIEQKRCGPGDTSCESERRDIASRGKTYTTIDQISGPLAAASLLAAVIVYAATPAPERPSTARLHWQAGASPHALRVQVSGSF
jgi:hypothetical protein